MMLSLFVLASCLAISHGQPTRGNPDNELDNEPVFLGNVLSIDTGTDNCSQDDIKKCYNPIVIVSIPDLNGMKIAFKGSCGPDIDCTIRFLNVQNTVQVKYYNMTKKYVLLYPQENHKIPSETVYMIIIVVACFGLFITCTQARTKVTPTNNQNDRPPMYTENLENGETTLPPQYIEISNIPNIDDNGNNQETNSNDDIILIDTNDPNNNSGDDIDIDVMEIDEDATSINSTSNLLQNEE